MIDVTRRGGKRGTRSGARRDGKIMVLHLLGSTEVRTAVSASDHIHILLLNLAANSCKRYHVYISPV